MVGVDYVAAYEEPLQSVDRENPLVQTHMLGSRGSTFTYNKVIRALYPFLSRRELREEFERCYRSVS